LLVSDSINAATGKLSVVVSIATFGCFVPGSPILFFADELYLTIVAIANLKMKSSLVLVAVVLTFSAEAFIPHVRRPALLRPVAVSSSIKIFAAKNASEIAFEEVESYRDGMSITRSGTNENKVRSKSLQSGKYKVPRLRLPCSPRTVRLSWIRR
jgi:hypothetical protein